MCERALVFVRYACKEMLYGSRDLPQELIYSGPMEFSLRLKRSYDKSVWCKIIQAIPDNISEISGQMCWMSILKYFVGSLQTYKTGIGLFQVWRLTVFLGSF